MTILRLLPVDIYDANTFFFISSDEALVPAKIDGSLGILMA